MLILVMRIIIVERYLHITGTYYRAMCIHRESCCLLAVANIYFKLFFVYIYQTVFRKAL